MTTAQEIFNTVTGHLLTQRERSWDGEQACCMYRMVNGLRCAVGCLLTDEEYSPSFETRRAESVACKIPRLRPHTLLLGKLQSIHDVSPPETWRADLRELAKDQGLQWPYGVTKEEAHEA